MQLYIQNKQILKILKIKHNLFYKCIRSVKMMTDKIINIINRKNKPKIFFCGIGGIGMSGLALLLNSCGYKVFGSNECENKNTLMLKNRGIQVFIGHNVSNLQDCDIFAHTSAVNTNVNCEAIEAKKRNLPIIKRGELLAILMQHYFNIVVAGSHGKTTTTAIIGHMLKEYQLQPNILLGGVLNDNHSNCVVGTSKYFVIESDESDGTFEKMPADIAVITNIDPEHMDFYKTKENLEHYFLSFTEKAIAKNENSGAIICIDDEIGTNIANKVLKNNTKNNVLTYSLNNSKADIFSKNIRHIGNGITFNCIINNVYGKTLEINDIFLSNMFGDHNVSNTLASIGVAVLLKQDIQDIKNLFSNFQGIQKRFTILGKLKHSLIVDDYAHNPQKISACINSAKHYASCNNLKSGITIVFEPHRYTRIRDEMAAFKIAMKDIDNIIVLPIYASSEQPIDGINDEYVYKQLKSVNQNTHKCSLDIDELFNKLLKIVNNNKTDLIVFMGAGKSSKIAHDIAEMSKKVR